MAFPGSESGNGSQGKRLNIARIYD